MTMVVPPDHGTCGQRTPRILPVARLRHAPCQSLAYSGRTAHCPKSIHAETPQMLHLRTMNLIAGVLHPTGAADVGSRRGSIRHSHPF